ncbi:tetratricopeptide tpr repeat protein [Grosmannia clavigera kw1407]|uniref:Tetratricopeptide tpr repeat protein n=1 Tax=Grosmannia clavigera (strain kw1407 / UAMH 11150) TaxID=655863 RepID=F0XDT1_GROCL|nr:tetratricopeptide tpr repeat protein [Grosmannia clavigera kw1407]EFX04063.1 tetratricopeptide tpr repeat protein [Grosmannia clavigera kw1407]
MALEVQISYSIAPKSVTDQLTGKFDEAVRLRKEGQLPSALAIFEEVYEARLREQGANNPDMLTTLHYIGMVCNEQGDYARAEAVNRDVLARREQVFGCGTRQTWGCLFNLLSVLNNQLAALATRELTTATDKNIAVTKASEAEITARQLLIFLEQGMGKDSPPALGTRRQLIRLLKNQGRDAEARQCLDTVLVLVESMSGPARDDELEAMREIQAELEYSN